MAQLEEPLNAHLNEQIDKIEEQMVAKKDWTMQGEITARDRPINSLLEEHLDFDVAARSAPKVTKEMNNNIEEMIKQRVKDELFDDPVRKQRAQPKVRVAAEDLMDYEKSKKGLGEIYEDDYKVAHLGYSANPEEDATREEIDELFVDLFYQLDSLSNAHFTPKPVKAESKITTQNVSAIMIEDKTPVIMSEAQTKSAKEVYDKKLEEIPDGEELSKEDKKAARLRKKRKIRVHLHKKEIKKKEQLRKMDMAMKEKYEVRYSKKRDAKDEKVDSKNEHKSNNFFAKMQNIGQEDREKKEAGSKSKTTAVDDGRKGKDFKL
ncbi:unnamed protein product [Moneuplotes crassus]|uniref:Uncharacterized protein n=1 Tax=Euplotes crassus TaxID=5936 RepID=A0AAD1XNV7_EUPCR|nr:unnamed protein product [Moneuplotes crassus]